ncbi:MAG: hypothetical protein P8X95_27810, partial [Anaerolineales bacterium]
MNPRNYGWETAGEPGGIVVSFLLMAGASAILATLTTCCNGREPRLYVETGWWPEAEAHTEQVRRLIDGSLLFMVA